MIPLRHLDHVFYIVFYTGGAGKLNSAKPGNPAGHAGTGLGSDAAAAPAVAGLAALALDHVAIAVRSFDEIRSVLEGLTGLAATSPERVESQGVEICFVGNVELIRPLAPENGVARFIERRGPGLHHIAYRTSNVAKLMDELTAEGYRFTSAGPMTGRGGHRIAFMHPKSAGGVLVELVESG